MFTVKFQTYRKLGRASHACGRIQSVVVKAEDKTEARALVKKDGIRVLGVSKTVGA